MREGRGASRRERLARLVARLRRLVPMSTPSHARRLGAALLVPLTLLLSACGAQISFTIHDDDTVDSTILVWDETGTAQIKENCNEKSMTKTFGKPSGTTPTYTVTDHNGAPACEIKALNAPIKDKSGGKSAITHADGKYTFVMDMSDNKNSSASTFDVEVRVTFPGEVTEVSGNGTKEGNTAVWKAANKETSELRAVGADKGGSAVLWIVLGVVGALVVGVIVTVIVVSRKKKQQPGAPVYAQPGQGGYPQPGQPGGYPQPGQGGYPQPGQPGYPQPGQPQPGQGGYPQSGGYPQPPAQY